MFQHPQVFKLRQQNPKLYDELKKLHKKTEEAANKKGDTKVEVEPPDDTDGFARFGLTTESPRHGIK